MRKILTILCTFIFTINLSVNAAMINVNEEPMIFTEAKEESGINDKNTCKEIYDNNKIGNQELASNSEVEKIDDSIILNELNTTEGYNVRIKAGEVYEFINKSGDYVNLGFIIADKDVSYDYYI